MENKQLFKKYHKRLMLEGLIKSGICALIVGFGVSIVPAIVSIANNNANKNGGLGLLLAFAIAVVAAIISVPLFYFVFFKPTIKAMIRRVDRLDMEQRLITMVELENDKSFMAMMQREDAKEKLRAAKAKRLKLTIFVLPLVVLTLITFCSLATMAVTFTEFQGRMPWSTAAQLPDPLPEPPEDPEPDPIEQPDAEITYFKISFVVLQQSGYFVGDDFQVVQRGDDSLEVIATPMPGFAFEKWEELGYTLPKEQVTNPKITIKNVTSDWQLYAKFGPAGSGDEGEPSDEESEVKRPTDEETEDEDEFDPNVIIDNEDPYYSERWWEFYYNYAMDRLIDGELPVDLYAMLKQYYDYLRYTSEANF